MADHDSELAALARVIACQQQQIIEQKGAHEATTNTLANRTEHLTDKFNGVCAQRDEIRADRDAAQTQAADAMRELNEAFNEIDSLKRSAALGLIVDAKQLMKERDEALEQIEKLRADVAIDDKGMMQSRKELMRRLRSERARADELEKTAQQNLGTVLHANCPWDACSNELLAKLWLDWNFKIDSKFRMFDNYSPQERDVMIKAMSMVRKELEIVDPYIRTDDTSQDLLQTDADGVPVASYDGRVY